MDWEIGAVAESLRGRDTGKRMCVVGTAEGFVLVCDGKERPLQRPKRKNPKHLKRENALLTAAQMRSNRAIKQALKFLSETECEKYNERNGTVHTEPLF